MRKNKLYMSKSKIRQNYVAIVKYLLETKNFRQGNINEKVYFPSLGKISEAYEQIDAKGTS